MNEKFQSFKEKASKFFSTISKVIVILISMAVGFMISNLLEMYKRKEVPLQVEQKIPVTHDQKEISVAINERGEIIIMNRKDGSYEIYSDSVGQMIFNHYASKMYLKANQK
jgi:hypothetical protein